MKSLCVGLVCLLLTCPAFAADASFDSALASAKENLKKPGGEDYDNAIGKGFGEKHAGTMVRCTESATEADFDSFDLVMRIAEDGKVEKALVGPETKVAACLLASVGSDVYPKPPEPGYWVHVNIVIKE